MPVTGKLVECDRCRRKILIERALIGVDHTCSITAVCWNCLPDWKKKIIKEKYKGEI